MKILLYGINFAPELTGVGKYTGEMAAWLAESGHEVRIVTAPPYYPDWAVFMGYRASRFRHAMRHGVKVWRCPVWVPKKPSGLTRLLHLGSFAVSSFFVMLRQAFWRPDAVWVVEPALMCAPTAWLTARLCGARAWLHVQDFEIDAAFELGLLSGDKRRKLVTAGERWLMRRFDAVSAISARMCQLLLSKGVREERVSLFLNWVDMRAMEEPLPRMNPLREEMGIAEDTVVALYSGNMGAKQGLEILAQAARMLQDEPSLLFVFCGGGAGRANLVALCQGLPNVRFLDLQPIQRLPALLAMADIHLLPQRAGAADLVMPSKLTGILASGRPVVATADPQTDLAQVVDYCGRVVPPESASAFARAILALAYDAPLRAALGHAGRDYASEYLNMDVVLHGFENQLRHLVREGQLMPHDEATSSGLDWRSGPMPLAYQQMRDA